VTINLAPYKAVETALCVKLEVTGGNTYLMTDSITPLTLGGDTYDQLGQFLAITDTSSELRLNNQEITVSISGIAWSSISGFMAESIKGSYITVIRGFFDPTTHSLLAIADNPTGKFKGIVNNYAINESLDGRNETAIISLICKSQVGMVQSRIAGRRTNPADEKLFFPNDDSMNRVPSLSNAKINFGGV
jgi:hypothetical protein